MRQSLTWLCIFIFGTTNGRKLKTQGPQESDPFVDARFRIIDGEPTDISRHPYQVSILNEGHFLCGGSLISRFWILTAAHCLVNKSVTSLSVVVGSTEIAPLEGLRVESMFPHPHYQPGSQIGDIALLKQEKPVELSRKVNLVAIAEVPPTIGRECNLTGWGRTYQEPKDFRGSKSKKGTHSPVLRLSKVSIISKENCVGYFSMTRQKVASEDFICVMDRKGKTFACLGDSGSPIVCSGVQVGVMSFGVDCGKYFFPDVTLSVSRYHDWIRQMMLRNCGYSPRPFKNTISPTLNLCLLLHLSLSAFPSGAY